MEIEEYETIRNEMLIRFRWIFEIIFFSIVSTSAIISWLGVRQNQTQSTSESPYIFILIGSGIVAYLFWLYLQSLKGITNQGSYLVIFHELGEKDLRYHIVSRFKDEIVGLESKWGRDGRNAAWLLIILLVANGVAPLYFLQEKILPNNYFEFFLLIIVVIVDFLIIPTLILLPLREMKEFMHKNMEEWLKVKEKLLEEKIFTDNQKLEEKIKKLLDCKNRCG